MNLRQTDRAKPIGEVIPAASTVGLDPDVRGDRGGRAVLANGRRSCARAARVMMPIFNLCRDRHAGQIRLIGVLYHLSQPSCEAAARCMVG